LDSGRRRKINRGCEQQIGKRDGRAGEAIGENRTSADDVSTDSDRRASHCGGFNGRYRFNRSIAEKLRRFTDGKSFSSKKFRAKKLSWGEVSEYFCGTKVVPDARKQFATKESSTVRTASEGGKVAGVRDYPDNRPFLGKGARQAALSQQDKPLTIEEVRELLNKGN